MSSTNSYLHQLNDVQRQAVTAINGPVLVVAGPGSGKTRVLTYRVAHLIEEGIPPWDILTLTFTNKAAREMKERIQQVVGQRADRVWAGTFHSIFARILRVEAAHLGYPSNFTIYDSDDSASVIRAIIKEMNLSTEDYNVNAIRARISSAKSNLIPPARYAQDQELMQADLLNKRPHLQKVYEKYVARCKRAGAMDFDDLLYRMFELLHTNPEGVREKYQQRFRYVMVDEFQDTNHLQYEIVKKLVNYEGSPRNICVVGDDAQSIYAFRGATIQNILDFEQDFKKYNIQVYKLEQNYRSTSHIVQAANEVITNNRKQIPKSIWSDKGDGERIRVLKALSDTEEGKRIVDAILEQKNRHHLRNRDIAILYRTNAQSRIFEEYLRRYNISYRVFGGLSFYQRKEVKDILAYFRLAVNAKDEEALRRVINLPRRGIGNSSVEKISLEADAQNVPMWDLLPRVSLTGRTRTAIDGFIHLIENFRQQAATTNAYQAAIYIAKQSGLVDSLKEDTTVEGMGRVENVNSLLDGIKEFVENQADEEPGTDTSLAAYIQSISLLTDQDEQLQDEEYITLMSVHSAKGLEFSSVFVVGMEEKLFPSFMAMDTPEGLDEERRLFYVAITRAEAFLTLSYSASRYRYGQMRYNEPSRFLNEVDLTHVEMAGGMGSTTIMPGMEPDFDRRSAQTPTSGVSGNFKRKTPANQLMADPKTFKPSPSDQIQTGMKVLHLKFGEGKVLAIDGGRDNRVATIFFQGSDTPERRIMLKFAKLQIL
ncbi:MAG: UvrD-helicase domain-containing protein [Saprospirales bacterium]|nr:UvrD-helicase domain-containing protein [Saprospirales bacterium]MBK8490804.1 UvrD-helicase domain-containing protein [Saprospirales bacterium]